VRFHVTESGPENGRPVVALHGWPQHHWVYRDLLADPPEGLRIIAPDLPGYGWSGPAPHKWTMEDVASDALALIDALGLDRVLLVGHDWGGFVGYLGLRSPRAVRWLSRPEHGTSLGNAAHLGATIPIRALLGAGDAAVHRSFVAAETANVDDYTLETVDAIIDERPDLVRAKLIALAEETSGAGPVLQEGLGDDGGVVRCNLFVDEERKGVARQVERVAGPVGHAADAKERDAVCIGDLLCCRGLLVDRIDGRNHRIQEPR
jgi:pimeloyl-ACP methyl ester carboxylesterase